jgi:pyruvate formate-lyase/glycerol dehydratase family glycyl radical enzyme
MSISDRVEKLRLQSLEAKETLSSERAELLTEYYSQNVGIVSTPVQRALAFKYILENKKVCIQDGELIVGEKGPTLKNAPTFPELCCHSLNDLDVLNQREKTSFAVDPSTRARYENTIIPFWKGKTMRELIFNEMTDEWKAAYHAGVFTEFMEQRAPGHTVLDDKIYQKGMVDFQAEITKQLSGLDYLNDPHAYEKQEELRAMNIAAGAIIRYAERHAERALELAAQEPDVQRKSELEKIAEVCNRVPAHSPRSFWEALQYYWFVHLGVTIELNTWDAFSPGHLDQHLLPFFQDGLIKGEITHDSAEELLQCFWIKFNNQPAPPKVGVTAEESGTYTDFAQINLGGVRPDGADGVNEVTYLLLDVIEEMRLLQPSTSIQVSKKNPDRFIKRATRIIRTGFGQPSVFNADLIGQELIRMGKTIVDARCGGSSGCVEVGAFGKENYNLTGYFNLPKVLEITLHNGVDPRTGSKIGIATGEPSEYQVMEDVFIAFEKQVNYFVDIKVRGNNIIERLYARYLPCPFLSLLIYDCISKGKDYHDGGARYNTTYIQGVGLGTMSDALSSIKVHVFERKTLLLNEFIEILQKNYDGQERLRQQILNRTPKYGNDDDFADSVMQHIFEIYFNAVDGRRNTKGGEYHINLLPTTVHVYFGSVTGATPDGRLAWTPLSEGVSPVQGADHKGPTAVLRSVAKMDHLRTGGTLLNQKFTPQVLESEQGLDKLVQLIRTYFRLDGHHIQFNVVDAATLRLAQQHPEQYRSLIVRVAGYSDFFCDLSKTLQDEIIARTEHEAF